MEDVGIINHRAGLIVLSAAKLTLLPGKNRLRAADFAACQSDKLFALLTGAGVLQVVAAPPVAAESAPEEKPRGKRRRRVDTDSMVGEATLAGEDE